MDLLTLSISVSLVTNGHRSPSLTLLNNKVPMSHNHPLLLFKDLYISPLLTCGYSYMTYSYLAYEFYLFYNVTFNTYKMLLF